MIPHAHIEVCVIKRAFKCMYHVQCLNNIQQMEYSCIFAYVIHERMHVEYETRLRLRHNRLRVLLGFPYGSEA